MGWMREVLYQRIVLRAIVRRFMSANLSESLSASSKHIYKLVSSSDVANSISQIQLFISSIAYSIKEIFNRIVLEIGCHIINVHTNNGNGVYIAIS